VAQAVRGTSNGIIKTTLLKLRVPCKAIFENPSFVAWRIPCKYTARLILVEKLWDIEYIKWLPVKSNSYLESTISVLVKGVIEGGINPCLNINASSVTVKLSQHSEVVGVTGGTHSTGFSKYQERTDVVIVSMVEDSRKTLTARSYSLSAS
jgi:hypothetical protein